MQIDLSTQSICEQVASTSKAVPVDAVLQMWKGISDISRDQLLAGKGLKLDSFGTFSLTRTGEDIFILLILKTIFRYMIFYVDFSMLKGTRYSTLLQSFARSIV